MSLFVKETLEILGVQHAIVELGCITHTEFLVSEIDESNQSAKLAVIHHWLAVGPLDLFVASGTRLASCRSP